MIYTSDLCRAFYPWCEICINFCQAIVQIIQHTDTQQSMENLNLGSTSHLMTPGWGTVLRMPMRLDPKTRLRACFCHIVTDGEFPLKEIVFQFWKSTQVQFYLYQQSKWKGHHGYWQYRCDFRPNIHVHCYQLTNQSPFT